MFKRIGSVFLLVSCVTMIPATSTQACVPGIDYITDYTWGPTVPVSICVLPGGQGEQRAFAYPGIEVEVELGFQLVDLAGQPVPGVELSQVVMWVEGGPPAICPDAWAGISSDAEGWVTVPFSGGGHVAPDPQRSLGIYLNLCPTLMLDVREDVAFNSPDLNGDLEVDLRDIPLFARDFYGPYNYRSDFNWDGAVDLGDLIFMVQAVAAKCP
jgi:hypothetical protein